MPKTRQKIKKEQIISTQTDYSPKFEKHFFEEMTYISKYKEDEKLLNKLRHTSSEKTTIAKIKTKLIMTLLFILSLFRKNPSKRISPKAKIILKQIKDLAVLYELGCVTDEEFILYKTELGTKYYDILNFAQKVDSYQEQDDFYFNKMKQMIKHLEKG